MSGPDRLRGILQDGQPMTPGNLLDRAHLGGLPVEMDGDDRPGPRRDGRLDLRRVDVVSVGLDIHEHRTGARPPDGTGRGEEGERRRDHLVSRSDVQGHQRKQKRIGARRTANPMHGPTVLGDLGLEPGDLRPEDEHLALEDLTHNRLDLVADRLVLRLEIQGGNVDWFIRNAHRRSLL